MKVVYIMSYGRSGSTLLNLLIGSSEEAYPTCEMNFWDKYSEETEAGEYYDYSLCGCGEKVENCQFWKDITSNFDKKFTTNTFPSSDENREFRKYYFNPRKKVSDIKIQQTDYNKLLKKVAVKTGSKVIVDASKDRRKLLELHRDPSIDLKVIHLIRHCAGVGNSYHRRREANFYKTIVSWIWKNLLTEKILKEAKIDYRQLSYDAFARNPTYYYRELGSWIGISLENARENLKVNTYHTIAGNPMKFEDFDGVKYDDTWKENLGWAKKLFAKIVGSYFNRRWIYQD